MSTLLFDLQEKGSAQFAALNEQLAAHNEDYIASFGAVGSDGWWAMYHAERIPKKIISGVISFVGLIKDFGEEEDVVQIQTEKRVIAYDRTDWWLRPEVVVGAFIQIYRTEVAYRTRTGPVTHILDVRILVASEEPNQPLQRNASTGSVSNFESPARRG